MVGMSLTVQRLESFDTSLNFHFKLGNFHNSLDEKFSYTHKNEEFLAKVWPSLPLKCHILCVRQTVKTPHNAKPVPNTRPVQNSTHCKPEPNTRPVQNSTHCKPVPNTRPVQNPTHYKPVPNRRPVQNSAYCKPVPNRRLVQNSIPEMNKANS